ncbi:sulfatase family protein [Paenibacillus sp. SAF-054]|uniref:sulfatase family protein n=1 Tax=unclassified Paenibacillus TaxID=185978 RepID=UPI003F7D747E
MEKPNILLITTDQQHWNTIGALNPEIHTPNLDRLVREGTTFTRAYCPNPTCTPSRASIITGMYPSQHGAWSLGTKLMESVHTVGEDFVEHGYRTALVGKAHFQPLGSTPEYSSLETHSLLQDLDLWRAFHGPFYGFEHIEIARNHGPEHLVGQHYAIWMEKQGLHNWREYFAEPTGSLPKEIRGRWQIPEQYHQNAWIAGEVNQLLHEYKNNDQNFFLWASFFDPHNPYVAPEPWDQMYDPQSLQVPKAKEGEHAQNPPHFGMTQQPEPDFSSYSESGQFLHGFRSHLQNEEQTKKDWAVYYGMISHLDKYVGKILDTLEELGLRDRTIVLFTSDHGDLCGHHQLNKKGAFHYEDLIRVPFMVRYPGHIPAGEVKTDMQSLVDLAPTFLSMCGIPVPGSMTGKVQSSVWLGSDNKVRDHVICENHHEPTTIHLKTYVEQRYKITVYFGQLYGEMYDLDQDPGEFDNLWHNPAFATLKQELLLKFLWAEFGKEAMPMPRISGA